MTCYNSIRIPAPIEDVWAILDDFTELDAFKAQVKIVEHTNDIPGDQPGCQRLLNGVFLETLLKMDHETYTIVYTIDQGPPEMGKPQGYIGTIQLHRITTDNSTFAAWSSRWESSEGDTAGFVNPICQRFLHNMQKYFAAAG